jgi:glycosyltransferase involved in cell wall biosynthesis
MRISIITVCLNNENLEKTIDSVLAQNHDDCEYWIIDGKSTNSITIDTISKYSNDQRVNIISEKDNGIYDAMNKGIKLATGEYLIFLNAGDCFYSADSLNQFITQHNNEEIIYGNLQVISPGSTWIKEYPSKLSFSYFLADTLPHPASFIKRSVFNIAGLYETNMLISADWALFINAICSKNLSYRHLNYIVSSFSYDGISSLSQNQEIIIAEKKQYLNNTFPLFVNDYEEFKIIKQKMANFKNSRLRKYFSYVFNQFNL